MLICYQTPDESLCFDKRLGCLMPFTLFMSHNVLTYILQSSNLNWITWMSFKSFIHSWHSYLFVFDMAYRCDKRCTLTTHYNHHPWLYINAAVRTNLNKGVTSWALPLEECSPAEVVWFLIGYFQFLLMSLLYLLASATMFQSIHELSVHFRQVTVVYTPRGSLSWPMWDEGVLKYKRVIHHVIVHRDPWWGLAAFQTVD